MTAAVPTRFGQINNAGADDALFLKQYAGEVLTSFVAEYALSGHVTERNISGGKSASFPALGTIGSGYHTPGAEILGRIVESNEIIINLNQMLISDAFIASIDEAKSHYDVRSEYTRQQGLELAKQRQMNELRCAYLAARTATSLVPGQGGGSVITGATLNSDAVALAAALRTCRQTFDEKNIPDQDTIAAMKPAMYYLLTSNKDLIDRDYNPQLGESSYKDAVMTSVARINLVKTNHMPSTNETADATVLAAYQANYATSVAAVFHKSAVGTLKLMDLALESTYDARRQGTLMLAKYALGHGKLRASAAIELKTA